MKYHGKRVKRRYIRKARREIRAIARHYGFVNLRMIDDADHINGIPLMWFVDHNLI